MILISHRGNVSGANVERENSPDYIDEALVRYDVEIDLWLTNEGLFLGHESPIYEIGEEYLEKRKDKLWIHCKSANCFLRFHRHFHCFFHNVDDIILTSKMHIITHVDYGPMEGCIVMMPEKLGFKDKHIKNCSGICSDIIEEYEHL